MEFGAQNFKTWIYITKRKLGESKVNGLYNFLDQNSLYIVMIIVLLVWLGIFTFTYKLDKKVKKLEERMNQWNQDIISVVL